MTGDKLVLLERFLEPPMAEIARGVLETNEIPCYLFDKNHGSANYGVLFALGGVRLMVHESDYKNARAILNELKVIDESEPVKKERLTLKKAWLLFISIFLTFISGTPTPIKGKKDL